MSQHLLTDCRECGTPCGNPGHPILSCDFCDNMACEFCFREIWKECPKCGRMGCRKHFDGMYCRECVDEDLGN